MSLQLAAQHLAAQGRGPDKQLVHMSPREVAGLQALAMSHGGSLTINPDTGLPEAGFLDNLLPAIIGAGLMFATGGASAAAMPGLFGLGMPATIGLGLGAFETARTGNLQKGLMAGLGAYGGAGMMGALAGAGAAGAAGAGANSAQEAFRLSEIAAQNAAAAPNIAGAVPQVAVAPELSMGAGATYPPIDPYSQFAPTSTQYGAFGEAPITSTPPAYDRLSARFPALDAQIPVKAGETYIAGIGEASPALSSAVGGQGTVLGAPTAVSAPSAVATSVPDAASAATTKGSSTVAERFGAMPTKDKFKYGLAALSPALLAQPKYKAPVLDNERYIYSYDPGYKGMPPQGYAGEYPYFQPKYTRVAAEGGLMSRARKAITGGDDNQGDDRQRYTYDPVKQQYTKIVPPVVPLAAIEAALPFVDTGGYGGGEMGGGPGLAGLSAAAQGQAYGDAAIGAFDAASQSAADAAAGAAGAAAGAAAGSGLGYGVGGYGGGGEGSGGFYAKGGSISHLGDYSDGGRLLRGPGDGVSDSIPAMIGRKQPARLADGEFVIPARIVSELGNGSTDAGARKLYAMMDRIQKARGKTVGKGKVAKNSKAEKYLPA